MRHLVAKNGLELMADAAHRLAEPGQARIPVAARRQELVALLDPLTMLTAAGESGTRWLEPFLARSPGIVHNLAGRSNSRRSTSNTSLRRWPVSRSSMIAGPDGAFSRSSTSPQGSDFLLAQHPLARFECWRAPAIAAWVAGQVVESRQGPAVEGGEVGENIARHDGRRAGDPVDKPGDLAAGDLVGRTSPNAGRM